MKAQTILSRKQIFCFCHFLIISLIFAASLSAQSNQSWPYDTTFFYVHDQLSPTPDSTLLFIETFEVNSQGYLIQHDFIRWDTISQTFDPKWRVISSRDNQGLDTLKEYFKNIDSGFELAREERVKYNEQGIKVYEEKIDFDWFSFSGHSKRIIYYRDDGKILTDSLWGGYSPNWSLGKYYQYTYQGALVTSQITWNSSSSRFTKQTWTYDNMGNITETMWSDSLPQLLPRSLKKYTYDNQNLHRKTLNYGWNETQQDWDLQSRDSLLYPTPGEEVRIVAYWKSGGVFTDTFRYTNILRDTLESRRFEKLIDNDWRTDYLYSSHYDELGREYSREYLGLYLGPDQDTSRYDSYSYIFQKNSNWITMIIQDVKNWGRPVKRNSTQINLLRGGLNKKSELFIRVFPNPSQGKVQVILPDRRPSEIHVYNLEGQLIHIEKGLSEQIEVDLGGYTPGVYLLLAQQNGQIGIERVVLLP